MTQRRRTGGDLTPEEADLWAHVTDTVHPMRRTRASDRQTEPGAAVEPAPPPAVRLPALERLAPPSTGKPRWQPLITQPTPRPVPPTGAHQHFDRRQARKIATGKVEIEGRLDLHGLREREAHLRLRGFLRQAQAQGKRTVLIITGKGRDTDDAYAPYDPDPDRLPRGVLRRNVPRWLAEAELAPFVVSFTTAHTRHGGEGALYVHLRRA